MTDLGRVLSTLADGVKWPEPSEHLPTRVVARIESDANSEPFMRRWVWGVTLAALALVITIPGTRQAVANLLQEAGVRIGFIEEVPSDLGRELRLGRLVSLGEAASGVNFDLRYPEALGPPEETYVDEAGLVSMLWEGPILLSQREGGAAFAEKTIDSDTSVNVVRIASGPALWVEGAEHMFTYLDAEGNPVEETARLAANVLLWSEQEVDHRLELTGGLERAIAIAASMRGLE